MDQFEASAGRGGHHHGVDIGVVDHAAEIGGDCGARMDAARLEEPVR